MYCLDYTKIRDVRRAITHICCKEFQTVKNQTRAYKDGKLTLVGFIGDRYSDPLQAFNRKLVGKSFGFESYKRLHATMLTLTKDVIITSSQMDRMCSLVDNFISSKKIKPFQITFKIIHPGIDKDSDKNKECSTGTVIALAKSNSETRRFLELRNGLAERLNSTKETKILFDDQTSTKKQETLWITLGHFNRPDDFTIDKELYDIFMDPKFFKFNHLIQFNALDIIKFRKKNLEDNSLIRRINLSEK